jgi:hypothetical protein
MRVSEKLRSIIEETNGIVNVLRENKTKEELDKEISVSKMSDKELEEILKSKKLLEFKKGIKLRLPSLYNFISNQNRVFQVRLVQLFNITSRFPDFFEEYDDYTHKTTSVDLACCILSYDFLLEVRKWQEVTGTILGEDRYESMMTFIRLISHCYDETTDEEYEDFNTEFSRLFVLINAKHKGLTRNPKAVLTYG